MPQELAPTFVMIPDGSIDGRGRVIEASGAYAIARGSVWIRKSDLDKAAAWGWQATGLESDGLMVVRR